MPSEAARPVVPVTHDPRTPVAVPPARWYRLADGRTLGWGGRTWEGYWKYGDAVFAALPVGGDRHTLGEPGEGGERLAGGWVTWHPHPYSPPSGRTPTPVQAALLAAMPCGESVVRSLDGNRQRTAYSLDAAGWVYWSGTAGWATLYLTAAGRAALDRYKAAHERRRKRWNRA